MGHLLELLALAAAAGAVYGIDRATAGAGLRHLTRRPWSR